MVRESLRLGIKPRGVRRTNRENNFLDYQLNDNNRLVKSNACGRSPDWPDVLFQVNKLKGRVVYQETLAKVGVDGKELHHRSLN